jgi:hypothetical protein
MIGCQHRHRRFTAVTGPYRSSNAAATETATQVAEALPIPSINVGKSRSRRSMNEFKARNQFMASTIFERHGAIPLDTNGVVTVPLEFDAVLDRNVVQEQELMPLVR